MSPTSSLAPSPARISSAGAPAVAATASGAQQGAARAYTIALGDDSGACDLTLPLVRGGCWSAFLGSFPLPADEALDALAAAAEAWGEEGADAPGAVELVGAPAACLLPALWLRTIWLGSESKIVVRWETVDRPGSDQRETLAAQLCAQIVDEIVCPDRGAASGLWGIETGPRTPAGAAFFDALLGLVDGWELTLRSGEQQFPVEWLVRARAALEACAERGLERVALYGAGTHTRALGPLLMQSRVKIACIIDDNTSIHGTNLWGFPVVSLDEAAGMDLDAVVISANSIEAKLWENARPLREAGVPVFRLYTADDFGGAGDKQPTKSAQPATKTASPYGPRQIVVAAGDTLAPTQNGAVLGLLAVPPGCEGFWAACDRELRARGVGLYALAWHVDAPATPLTGMSGSYTNTATLGMTWPEGAPLGPEPDAELFRRCIAFDRVFWSGVPNTEALARRGVRAAFWIVEQAVQRLRPRAALMWHGGASFCLAAESVLRRRGVPILSAERGAINPTVILDRIGWARSEMTDDPAWIERMRRPATAAEIEAGRRIASELLRSRAENWGRIRAADERAAGSLGPTIAFFPTIEAGAEIMTDDQCAAAGNPLGDSPRACERLLRAVETLRPAPTVLIKLHPNEPDRQRYQRMVAAAMRRGVRAEITDELGIHDAIERGHVVATTSASVGWIALAAGAPLVSMNRRGYSECAAVFQADTEASLTGALDRALSAAPSKERRELGLAALARYATGYCYSHADDLVASGVMGPRQAADRILRELAPKAAPSQPGEWLNELAAAAGLTR